MPSSAAAHRRLLIADPSTSSSSSGTASNICKSVIRLITRPFALLPFRPFAFVAKRTLLFFAAVLISYVTISSMMGGYEGLSSSSSRTGTGGGGARARARAAVHLVEVGKRRPQTDHGGGVNDRRAAADGDGGGGGGGGGNDTGGQAAYGGRAPKRKNGASKSVGGVEETSSNWNVYEKNDSANEGIKKPFDGPKNPNHSNRRVVEIGENQQQQQQKKKQQRDRNLVNAAEVILSNHTAGGSEDDRSLSTDRTNKKKHSDNVHSDDALPLCPLPPPDLTGKMKQAVLLMSMLKEADVIRAHPELSHGGHWKPPDCKARYKVAIIVPFRDRQSHLNRLIDFLIPMLERQLLDFRFIVTEQYGKDLFNKGRIMNAAFLFADQLGVDCVIFHDVDMFPQDDRNLYYCPDEPKHMGAFVNTLGYELWYDYIVGGVLAINMEHYRQVNGYSNVYWAWGGEDDDMGYRILANNLTILRPDKVSGTYTMLKHIKRQRTAPSMIYKMLNTAKTRWVTDGLSNVEWKVVKLIAKPLYYHLYVDVGIPPDEWRYEKASTKRRKRKR